MLRNRLFTFIENYFVEESETLKRKDFEPQQNLDRRRYFLHKLKLTGEKIIHDNKKYSITEHHVSICENQDNRNERLTEWHYTSILSSKGKKYKLHVFFDETNEVIAVDFFLIKDKKLVTQVLDEDLKAKFIKYAVDSSCPIMEELHKQHQQFMTTLENEYNKLEKELALIQSNPDQHDECKNKLKEIILVLAKLSACHYSESYKAFYNLFKAMNIVPLQQKTTSDSSKETPVEDKKEKENSKAETIVVAVVKKQEIAIAKKPLKELIGEVVKAKENFERNEMKNATKEEKLKKFLDFDKMLCETLIPDSTYSVTIEDIKNVQTLFYWRAEAGKSLLTDILLNNNYELAMQLKEFVKLLSLSLAGLAVNKNNKKLLDFLIKHQFPIQDVRVKDQPLILYCYNQKPLKIDCFSMLVKYNPEAIMTKADDGLSIACNILRERYHPLMTILTDNQSKTIDRPGFRESLIAEIETFLVANKQLDKETKTKLTEAMNRFKNEFKNIPVINKVIEDDILLKEKLLQAYGGLGEETAVLLNKDASYQKKLEDLRNILCELNVKSLDRKPEQARNAFLRKKVDDSKFSSPPPNSSLITPEQLKFILVYNIEQDIKMYQLELERFTEQSELYQGNTKPRIIQACKNQQEINKQLKQFGNRAAQFKKTLMAEKTKEKTKEETQDLVFVISKESDGPLFEKLQKIKDKKSQNNPSEVAGTPKDVLDSLAESLAARGIFMKPATARDFSGLQTITNDKPSKRH